MRYIVSNNNAKIYSNTFGSGSALLLAHGMGNTKEIWNETGWIDILKNHFTVIPFDIRGNGESSKSYEPSFYSSDNILNDINNLVTHLGFTKFNYFGHSYGATIGLQLCKYNNNLEKCICAGTSFGDLFFKTSLPNWIKQYEKYQDIKDNHVFAGENLSSEDINWLMQTDLLLNIAQMKAWTHWTGIEPSDVKCKLAIYSGTKDNPLTLNSLLKNKANFIDYNIEMKIFDELNHKDLISNSKIVSPWILNFLNS
ncbi:MAG: alpha/beta fold hydrolase [Clostridium celatum]|nr:alpha/beta fold hydrolase [Clostridium celatum]